ETNKQDLLKLKDFKIYIQLMIFNLILKMNKNLQLLVLKEKQYGFEIIYQYYMSFV
ncbi:hypothetical protein IMG5_043930, partial [Ichthyophthirius multifiliis]